MKQKKRSLEVLFEDEKFVVISKPAGLTTMGSTGEISAYSVILNSLRKSNPRQQLFAAHRLDKATSGTVIFAKDEKNWKILLDLFKQRKTQKNYKAIVSSEIKELFDAQNWRDKDKLFLQLINQNLALEIKLPIFGIKNKSRVDFEKGSDALSIISLKKISANYVLLDIVLKTGRFHQIRTHLSYLGYPVLGDDIYRGEEHPHGLFLHAESLEFYFPPQKKNFKFNSPVPSEFFEVLK